MSIALFALSIGMVAVIGGLFIEYQKTKAQIASKTPANLPDYDNLLREIASLKKRVQNLEAIAAAHEEEERTPLLDRDELYDEMIRENTRRVGEKAKSGKI